MVLSAFLLACAPFASLTTGFALAPLDLDDAVTAAELRAHVAHLAADELAGRETSSPGARLAAGYLADVLAAYGLRPGGDDGTFLQSVPLERVRSIEPAVLVATRTDGTRFEAVDGLEMLVRRPGDATDPLELVVVGADDEVPAPRRDRALYFPSSSSRALERLEQAGHEDGVGCGLLLFDGRPRLGRRVREPDDRWSRGRVRAPDARPAQLRVHAGYREELAAGRVARVEFRSGAVVEPAPCANVVGWIEGRTRPDEVVVLSAHYDHVGVARDSEASDTIYNGADDDASGCAAVCEIAGALARSGAADRTVVVLLATGEEKGLLGTEYYLEHPLRPLEQTVVNLNFEMVGRPDALVGAGRLWLTGWERSNLGPAFRAAGLDVSPDERPEHHFFRRSDNWAFAVRGIVAQTLSSYGLHDDYHRVTDELETLDFDHMERAVRDALAAVRRIVEGPELTPAWAPGGNPAEDE